MNDIGLADGVYPVLPTTFDASRELDLGSFRRLVRFVVQMGARGMLVLGVMGEAPKLLASERAAVIDAAVHEAGGLAVLVSAPRIRASRALARSPRRQPGPPRRSSCATCR